MEKATSTIRRSGAFLWSFGTGHQELNLIISDIKILKSQIKAVRDSQQTILHDITNWTCVDDNRALQELFLHLSDLNALWSEVQSSLAEQISEFRHNFEMILESEKNIDAARNKFAECELAEQKAIKKLKKVQKKKVAEDIRAAETKIEECKALTELSQAEVSAMVKENEAVKLIRIKNGLLKLSEAFLGFSHKCIYIFEAQKDIVKGLPDVEDKEIHEVRFDGLSGAKDVIQRARTLINNYMVVQNAASLPRNTDPPPPYSATPYPSFPYNPYYQSPGENPEHNNTSREGASGLYPTVTPDEELANAVSAAKI